MIQLESQHLVNRTSADKAVVEIREEYAHEFTNVNMILHTNNHWIEQVRIGSAHDPSFRSYANTIEFQNGGVRATGQVLQSDSEAIKTMKLSGKWDSHVQSCEKLFEESQNWTRLMSLVQIYEFWEGDFRSLLFNHINLEHSEINGQFSEPVLGNDLFGDLRHIRNKFLHGRGIYKDDDPNTQLRVITGVFSLGHKMELSADKHNEVREIIYHRLLPGFPKEFVLCEKPKR